PPATATSRLSLHDALPICVVLAVAGRAMRIREGDDVAGARIDLPVAAKGVRPVRLRPAMHIDNQRVLFRWVEVVRLDHKDVNFLDRKSTRLNSSHSQISYA